MNPQEPGQQPNPTDTSGAQPIAPGADQAYVPQPDQMLPSPALTDPVSQPSQPGPSREYTVDYLNQIAPASHQKTLSKFAVFGMIIAVVVVAVFAVMLLLGGGAPNFSVQAKTVQARLTTLQDVTKAQQKNLKENDISSMNATLSTSLASMDAGLTQLLKTKGIKPSTNTSSSIAKSEKIYSEKLASKFNDAYLTGTLDRSYASEMIYQLAILKSQMQKLKTVSNSKSVSEFYTTNITTLDAATKQFSEFAASK